MTQNLNIYTWQAEGQSLYFKVELYAQFFDNELFVFTDLHVEKREESNIQLSIRLCGSKTGRVRHDGSL